MHIIVIFTLLVLLLLGLSLFTFWIWMLIDSISNRRLTDTQRAAWALVIVVVGVLGALIYFFVGRTSQASMPSRQYRSQAYRQPQYKPPVRENFPAYQEGYRPQDVPSLEQAWSDPQAEVSEQQAQYEQIQISYPE